LKDTEHGGLVVVVICIFACILGLAMESNQSLLLYIPKKEYERVLSDIVKGSRDQEMKLESKNKVKQSAKSQERDLYTKHEGKTGK
jgi:hypothetical protein